MIERGILCMHQQNDSPHYPNHFEFKGSYLLLTYDKASIDGQSKLVQRTPLGEISRTFSGDQIRICDSELGTQLTVTLGIVPDFMTTLLTLFIPVLELHADTTLYQFKTLAIVTKIRPALEDQNGATQSYLTYVLSVKAQVAIS